MLGNDTQLSKTNIVIFLPHTHLQTQHLKRLHLLVTKHRISITSHLHPRLVLEHLTIHLHLITTQFMSNMDSLEITVTITLLIERAKHPVIPTITTCQHLA